MQRDVTFSLRFKARQHTRRLAKTYKYGTNLTEMAFAANLHGFLGFADVKEHILNDWVDMKTTQDNTLSGR